jgi:hypothetical protein
MVELRSRVTGSEIVADGRDPLRPWRRTSGGEGFGERQMGCHRRFDASQ